MALRDRRLLWLGDNVDTVPLWLSPAQASGELRFFHEPGSAGETTSGGRVTTSPDKAPGGLNPVSIPAGIAGSTGPTLLPTAFYGSHAWDFDGVLDALITPAMSFLPAGGGDYSLMLWSRRKTLTTSLRKWGFQNDRPFIGTSGEDTIQIAMDGAFGTAGVVGVDGGYGWSMWLATFKAGVRQRLYRDAPKSQGWAKLIGETANTDPGSSLHGGRGGYAYNGHPTVGNSYCPCQIAMGCGWRGELTFDDARALGKMFAYRRSGRRGPLLWGIPGQSNERADQRSNSPRLVTRRDINAIRDSSNADDSFREQQDGPLNDTVLAGSLRGFDVEALYRMADDYSIDVDLVNVAKSGTGFRLPADGSLNPNGWASPRHFGGDGALMWRRWRTAMDLALSRRAYTRIHVHPGWKETDGLHPTSAAAFEDGMVDFMEDTRSLYGNAVGFSLPLISAAWTSVTHQPTIRTAQNNIVAGVPDVVGDNCDDQTILPDGFHLTGSHHDRLGELRATHLNGWMP